MELQVIKSKVCTMMKNSKKKINNTLKSKEEGDLKKTKK